MLNPHRHSVNAPRALREGLGRTVGLWRWRHLVVDLARREFKARYAGSVLGITWAVVEPAVQFGLYLLLFSVFFGMRLESSPDVGSFGVYLIGGLVPYLALQEAIVRAVGFARSSAGLIRHVQVPLEVLLAGAIGAIMARYAVAFALAVAAAALLGTVAWSQLIWLLVGVPLLLAVVWGLGLALLPAGAFLPDLAQIVGTGTMVVFFLTPIVYPESELPARAIALLPVNPVVGLIDTFRAGLVGTSVTAWRLGSTVLFAVVALVLGGVTFGLRERAVRDVV